MQAIDTENADIRGPRENLSLRGPNHLSDAELLAVLLGTGTAREPVGVLAARLLTNAGGLRALLSQGTHALTRHAGLGESKAARLVAAAELGRRISARPLQRGVKLRGSEAVFEAFGAQLSRCDQEQFFAIALDARQRVMAQHQIGIGGLSACAIGPADVFRPLVRDGASATLFVHNHPSGDPSPSPEDIALTERLVASGQLLGVQVLDHVVVAAEGFVSLLDAGLMAPTRPIPARRGLP